MMLTPKEIATLFDGEGTLSAATGWIQPYIQVEMTDSTYPKLLHEQFGGLLYLCKRVKYNPNQKDSWRWQVNSEQCREVILYALPELKLKRAQAECLLLMLDLQVGKGNKMQPRTELMLRKLLDILRDLNKRGRRKEILEVIESLEEK